MNTTARLVAVFLLAALPVASVSAADSPVVIERAPDADQSAAQAEAAALRRENERLQSALTSATGAKTATETALQDATRELAKLRAKLAQLDKPAAADLEASLAAEKSRADQLVQEKAALEAQLASGQETAALLAEAQKRITTLQTDNDLLKAASADHARLSSEFETLRKEKAAAAAQPDLAAKLAESEDKLAMALRSYSQLQAESEKHQAASDELDALRPQVEKLLREKSDLEARLAAVPADRSSELSAKLTESDNKLSTSLASFNQLQAENDRLKAEAAAQTTELDQLRRDKSDLEARLAATPVPAATPAETTSEPAEDVTRKLAETEDKLSTALRSYSLLSAELDQVKADSAAALEKLRTESAAASEAASATANKAAALANAQATALRDELRQTQAYAAALATENARLRTQLALSGPPPGTTMATPVRPGTPAATAALTPTLVPTAAPEAASEAAPAASQGPRTHVIVAGDNLAKLARRYYGNANRWDEILRANRDVIKNENVLPLGATIRIP